MSVSLFYSASRSAQISPTEQKSIDALVTRADRFTRSEWGESFIVYAPGADTPPGIIFEGSTKLPEDEEALWNALQHRLALLSQIRNVLSDATWRVHVEDHDMVWDADAAAYDPMR